jgi:hypothetical protein
LLTFSGLSLFLNDPSLEEGGRSGRLPNSGEQGVHDGPQQNTLVRDVTECKTKSESEFVNRMKMVRDLVRTELVTLSSAVDSVYRRHRPQHALVVHISIEPRLRGVTYHRNSCGNGNGDGTHASAQHHHGFCRC